jgi:hypothetical protein
MGERNPGRYCCTCGLSKRDHLEGWIGQAGTASNIKENGYAPSGVRVCILSANLMETSHLPGYFSSKEEAAIMINTDTKKDVHTAVEIHYNTSRHEPNASWRGASEGCRPKLPRWPFSGSSCTQASGTAVHGSMVGNLDGESSFFVHHPAFFRAPRAARLGVAVLPPASFLTLSRLVSVWLFSSHRSC